MTITVEDAASPQDKSPSSHSENVTPKAVQVRKLLQRAKGATLGELQQATSWQAHTVRAFLSRIRKKGDALTKEQRRSGETSYRLATKNASPAAA